MVEGLAAPQAKLGPPHEGLARAAHLSKIQAVAVSMAILPYLPILLLVPLLQHGTSLDTHDYTLIEFTAEAVGYTASAALACSVMIEAAMGTSPLAGRGRAARTAPFMPAVLALGLPLGMVYLAGEAGHPLWYEVYLLFLPPALVMGAQGSLVVASLNWRSPAAPPLAWTLLGLVGSLGLVLANWLPYYPPGNSPFYGEGLTTLRALIILAVLALVVDLVLVDWSRRTRSPR